MYIGKTKRLKERALQHIKYLFSNCDNNAKLQKEFSEESNKYYLGCLQQLDDAEELDEWESIYYLAAIELFGEERVYNKVKLDNEKNQIDKIKNAKSTIENILAKGIKGTEKYTNTRCSKMKDWISTDIVENLSLETKSMKELFENGEIDFLLFGKAGDYIGEGNPQTISDILQEKVEQLNSEEDETKKRCLWATSGPIINEFLEFHSLYKKKYGENSKLYVLFKLTINAYNQTKEMKRYFWEKDGTPYTDTAPAAKTVKALVLKEFYVVKEDFDFEELTKKYYKCSKPAYHSVQKKYVLNSDNTARQTLYPAISKAIILDKANEDIREALGFSEDRSYLLDELKSENCIEDMKEFPSCNEEEHPFYYILAEVEDYVLLQPEE